MCGVEFCEPITTEHPSETENMGSHRIGVMTVIFFSLESGEFHSPVTCEKERAFPARNKGPYKGNIKVVSE